MRKTLVDISKDVPRRLQERLLASDGERPTVRDSQLRVVVQHLLEMRHMPTTVCRVAMEALNVKLTICINEIHAPQRGDRKCRPVAFFAMCA